MSPHYHQNVIPNFLAICIPTVHILVVYPFGCPSFWLSGQTSAVSTVERTNYISEDVTQNPKQLISKTLAFPSQHKTFHLKKALNLEPYKNINKC